MAENEKHKSGAGKFFLGALLGAAAGAIAGKFISVKQDDEEEPEDCDCGGECEHCEARDEKIAELKDELKEAKAAAKEAKAEKKTEKGESKKDKK